MQEKENVLDFNPASVGITIQDLNWNVTDQSSYGWGCHTKAIMTLEMACAVKKWQLMECTALLQAILHTLLQDAAAPQLCP